MNKEKEIQKINDCISELVYEKTQLKKAYNYYHGKRDAEQFKHLENNYGIGTPTSVGFTPLVKKHIDVLVGEYLELDPDLSVTCKDDKTLSNITRDKKLKIDKELYDYLSKYLKNALINVLMGSQKPMNDPYIEKELQKIKDDIDRSYVSDYEIAAQNILAYFKYSRDLDLKNKMRELFTDLLIGGMAYYRVKGNSDNTDVKFDILNPLDTFIERNRNSYYLNKSPRAVIRRWMNKEQILAEFGDELSFEAKNSLNKCFEYDESSGNTKFVRSIANIDGTVDPIPYGGANVGLLGGLEVTPVLPWGDETKPYFLNKTLPVYECEWIEFEDDKMTRHEGVKIGQEIFITRGKNEDAPRSASNPKEVTLSVNGLFFSDKNGQPFSIMLSTADLQDRYDMLIYYRDNLIATSGTVGDWIDVASLPSFLQGELPEKIQRWFAYKKNGIALYDSSQDGANIINTTFNGYDDTVKGQSIQAIQLAIQSIEEQVSSITGVLSQALGNIQQRDAVSNVKVGVRQSTLLTKQYFSAMDNLYKEVNYDLLNEAKVVYKNGLKGTLVLGDRLVKVFTALPKHYTMTDFDVHIQDSSEAFQVKEEIKALNIELIKTQQVDAEMAVDIATAKNITDLKQRINLAIRKRKAENDQLSQMQQQIQQYEQQLKDLQQQLQQTTQEAKALQNKLETNSEAKIKLETKRVEIEDQTRQDKADYNEDMLKLKERQLEVERLQILDGNPYNDKIRDV